MLESIFSICRYKLRERSEPKLSPTNLLEVLKALYRVRSKWYYVGLALGISSDTLDCIEQDENKVIGRLKEALKEWLQGNGKECTWNVIVNALKEAPVRAVSLAATLKRRHCKGKPSVVTQMFVQPYRWFMQDNIVVGHPSMQFQ